mmetsp:Transcript_29185/g.68582  ORF Transcript_29185/g.68582 Transcript_29185/m.68582 type:complete len:112 (+) Transcript_29185:1693-2028(+)
MRPVAATATRGKVAATKLKATNALERQHRAGVVEEDLPRAAGKEIDAIRGEDEEEEGDRPVQLRKMRSTTTEKPTIHRVDEATVRAAEEMMIAAGEGEKREEGKEEVQKWM